jgi:Spy/CpxP family protein refolding chaperone
MRKTRVLAVVVASLVSAASFAQAQSATPAPQADRHAMQGAMNGERGRGGMLRGIKLSETERTKLAEVRRKYEPDNRKLAESRKSAMQEARALRQKGDTTGARAVLAQQMAGRDSVKALRDRQVAEIRSALSPENQKQFDLNVQDRAKHRAERAAQGGGKHGGHRGRGRRATNG